MQVTHNQIVEALNPRVRGIPGAQYLVYSDSRQTVDQGLFWALQGEQFDGHDYILQAIKAGARGVVTHKPLDITQELLDKGVTIYEVQDTLLALQNLARHKAQSLATKGARIIGITGSNGKTTCKEFTFQIAHSVGYKTHSNKGSFNNHFGVPFNILSASPDTRVLICEMGMNHAGEISTLVKIAEPDIVCCTMVGTAHIEHFGTIDKIAEAKSEIYQPKAGRIGVFNLSNPWTAQMAASWEGPRLSFCDLNIGNLTQYSSDVTLGSQVTPDGFLEVSGDIQGVTGSVRLAVFGPHHVTNIMAAAAINLALGATPQQIWDSFCLLKTPWGRTQLLQTQSGATLLFDAYNANPESMKALLKSVQDYPISGRRWALFGEMKELGNQSDTLHFELGSLAATSGLAKVVFVGQYLKSFEAGFLSSGGLLENLIISDSYNESLAITLGSMLEPKDFLVIKGSRGMKLERFVPYFNPIHFEGKT